MTDNHDKDDELYEDDYEMESSNQIEIDYPEQEKEAQATAQAAAPAAPSPFSIVSSSTESPSQYKADIEKIINKHFEYTREKLSPDDPLIGLLLAQKYEINEQVSSLKKTIQKDAQESAKQIAERLIEVDKRFETAKELAEQLSNQKNQMLMELGNLHQKNIVMYAEEQEKKLDDLTNSVKPLTWLSVGALLSSFFTLVLLIIILKM